MDFGNILNTFVEDAHIFWPLCVALAASLWLFSMLYNRWMDDLAEAKSGYTALLVALGNGVTLAVVAVLSWKAAVLVAAAFVISGAAMIAGDIRRNHLQQKKTIRALKRKPLPYAAAGLIDEAVMLISEGQRTIKTILKGPYDAQRLGIVGIALTEAIAKLNEARRVEGE